MAAWFSLVFRGDYLSPQPLAVEGLAVDNGLVPGQVDVAWQSLDNVMVPIKEYLVLAIGENAGEDPDWAEARELGTYSPLGPDFRYRESYGPEAGLVPGLPYRFTVRGRDLQDRMSPVRDSVVVTVHQGYRVSGTVIDTHGLPLAGIPVEISYEGMTGDPLRVFTDDQGAFSGYSLWGGAVVHVRTLSRDVAPGAWYDYAPDQLLNGAWQNLDITLIPNRGVDPACSEYGDSFLTYVRTMTKTRNPTSERPNTLFNKWDHYPLSVYVPDHVNKHGLDLGALCRTAPTIWNEDMDEVFFVTAGDSGSADVVFRFGTNNPGKYGEASIILPAGNHFIGDVIPQKMEVYIREDIGVAQGVQEVALHELGHVLGAANHSLCSDAGYLMYISSFGVLDNGPENAIHPDEKALIRCLRYLPQGVDMAAYEE